MESGHRSTGPPKLMGRSGMLIEAWESLAAAEGAIAGWRGGTAREAHESLVMLCHRLRGTAALYGFEQLSALAGGLEDLARQQGARPLDPGSEIAAVVDDAIAAIAGLLDRIAAGAGERSPASDAALERLVGVVSPGRGLSQGRGPSQVEVEAADPAGSAAEARQPAPPATSPSPSPQPADVDRELVRFRTDHARDLDFFAPEAEGLLEGIERAIEALHEDRSDRDALDGLLRGVHTLKGAALMIGCQPIGELAHRTEDVLIRYQRQKVAPPVEALDGAGEAAGVLRTMLDILIGSERTVAERHREALLAFDGAEANAGAPSLVAGEAPEPRADEGPTVSSRTAGGGYPRRPERGQLDALFEIAGDMVIARDRVLRRLEGLDRMIEQLGSSRRRLAETIGAFDPAEQREMLDGTAFAEARQGPGTGADEWTEASSDGFSELELDRYDETTLLSRQVLEIAEDFSEIERELGDRVSGLHADAEGFQKLIRGLRREAARTRLVPIGPRLARYLRLAEDVAEEYGKPVSVRLEGEEIGAEVGLIERLGDPLLHLLQNAIVHGIEPAEERAAAGKPEEGEVIVRASAAGSSLRLEVIDDGRGIDVERLKTLAVEQRFLAAERAAELSDEEAVELVFLPGLSTSRAVSRRAGRGLGMDVVRDAALHLDGDVAVASEPGRGSRFTLTVPSTLTLTEALIVEVGNETYGLPMPAVKRVLDLPWSEVEGAHGGLPTVEVEGELAPLRFAHDLFEVPRAVPSKTPGEGRCSVLAIRAAGRRLALAVDQVVGLEEVVVRPFDPLLAGVALFSGGTVNADGRVGLLIDLAALFDLTGRLEERPPRVEQGLALPTTTRGKNRILLVDDSFSVRKILSRYLERAGFEVASAKDGLEALELFRAGDFAAVVTDLEMPRLNGFELIADLRRRHREDRLPIFVITTRIGRKHAQLAHQLGATAYLGKPIDEDSLVRRIQQAVGEPSEVPG